MSNTIQLTANLRGAVGNAFTLSSGSAAIVAGGATFSGGVDYPIGLLSLQTGKNVFDIAADKWDSDHTNAMRVIEDCVNSERGRFYVAGDGTITFENKEQNFKSVMVAPVITLNQDYLSTTASQSVQDVYNRIEVQYTPRGFLVVGGIVAKNGTYLQVPGTQIGNDRWNPTAGIPKATAVLKLPFTDPTTQMPMGARNVITPLVPGTDYSAWESIDASGNGTNFNYSNSGRIAATAAINGANVELTFTNNATGSIFLTGIQVRGDGITTYNPATAIAEDAASITKHQRRLLSLSIPLNSSQAFMEGLAAYLLSKFKDQVFRVKHIDTNNLDITKLTPDGGANLFSVKQGDSMLITDNALGITAQKVRVIGRSFDLNVDKTIQIGWDVFMLDTNSYWLLGDSTYGKLGASTRLGL